MTRLEYNKLIILRLADVAVKFPDLRFVQILINEGILSSVDDNQTKYYEESEITFNSMRKD